MLLQRYLNEQLLLTVEGEPLTHYIALVRRGPMATTQKVSVANLASIQFHVAPAREITDSLAGRTFSAKPTHRTFTADISISDAAGGRYSEVLLSDLVIAYREKAPQRYYTAYVSLGVPTVMWEKIGIAAKRAGMVVDSGEKMKEASGHVWSDLSIKSIDSPYYIVCNEPDDSHGCYNVADPAGFFNYFGQSLTVRIKCTMRLKKHFPASSEPGAHAWRLGLTPLEIYIVNSSRFVEGKASKRTTVDYADCAMDSDFESFALKAIGAVGDEAEGQEEGEQGEEAGGEEEEEEEEEEGGGAVDNATTRGALVGGSFHTLATTPVS